jgi:uncharacterized membrane protein YuzA (DUF378 family)
MKKILIALTLLFTQTSYAGVGETVSNAIDSTKAAVKDGINVVDTSSNFKMVYTDIKDGISALASGLKVGAEHVYEVLVKQQIANAITYLIIGIIGLILMANFFKGYKDPKEEWGDGDMPTGLGMLRTFQVFLAGILIIFLIFNIDEIVMGFVNPEFGAIETIIDIIKENK